MNKKYMLVLLILCTALLVFFTACDNSTGSGTKPGPKSGDSTLPAPIHQWLLDGNGNDQVGGKNLTINTDYNTFAQDAGWGHQVMDCAGTNSPDEPYDLCWVPDFNGPVMTELTATVWVNPDNIAGIRGVLTFEKPTNDNAGLYIFNYYGGYLYLTYNENENTNLDLDNDFTDYRNQWLLLALIFKGDTATLYVNGIKTGEIQGTIPCAVWWNADGSLDGTWGAAKDVQMKPPTIDSFWIGGQQSTQHFIGMMSDVRLYDKALNAVQIQALIDEAPQAIKDQLATE